MKTTHTFRLSYLFFLFIIIISACGKTKMDDKDDPITTYDKGIIIANFGSSQNGESSISYYHRKNGAIINKLFQKENEGKTLAQTMESLTVFENRVYMVSKDKLIITDLKTMKLIETISGFEMPRYFLGINSRKAYVSDWGDGFEGKIKVVDLSQGKITKTIMTNTAGPERMLLKGSKVYLTNSGGFISDDRVSIIDSNADKVLTHIKVGVDPINIVADSRAKIWVLSKGFIHPNNPEDSRPGRLSKIVNDRETLAIELSNTARSLVTNGTRDVLYFVMDGWVYDFPTTSTQLKTAPFINKFYFRIGLDPQTGNLFASDPKNYNTPGEVVIYDDTGAELESFDAGVVPGAFYFN